MAGRWIRQNTLTVFIPKIKPMPKETSWVCGPKALNIVRIVTGTSGLKNADRILNFKNRFMKIFNYADKYNYYAF